MMGEKYRRRLVWLVGALAGLLTIGLAVLLFDDGDRAFIGGPGSLLGWTVPLVALFVIVAVTWLLLARDAGDGDGDDDKAYVACDACGHSILREWRLCPYCGTQLREWNPGGRGTDKE
jgi:hypothetical protein